MGAKGMSIGRLAQASGCKVPTIRYYEQIGIMPKPDRTEGNQRIYDKQHADRLSFIRHGRDLGFTLDDIRDLLRLSEHPEAPCDAADEIAKRHLGEIRLKIKRLRLLEAELERMANECSSDEVAKCRVIEILSDHNKCLADEHLRHD